MTSEEYRRAFEKCIDIVRAYRTPFWISEFGQNGSVSAEDQQWAFTKMMPEAVRNGLRKVASVSQKQQYTNEYLAELEKMARNNGVELKFFTNRSQAEKWIENFIEPQLA